MARLTEKAGYFIVCHVTREDIADALNDPRQGKSCKKNAKLPVKFAKITDEQMHSIAEKMNDLMCDGCGYRDACRFAYEKVVLKNS